MLNLTKVASNEPKLQNFKQSYFAKNLFNLRTDQFDSIEFLKIQFYIKLFIFGSFQSIFVKFSLKLLKKTKFYFSIKFELGRQLEKMKQKLDIFKICSKKYISYFEPF
jgi:hypothetical protein